MKYSNLLYLFNIFKLHYITTKIFSKNYKNENFDVNIMYKKIMFS